MSVRKNIAIALRIDEPYPNHQLVFEGIQRFARERPDWNCLIDEHPGFQSSQRGKNYPRYDGVIARADDAMQARLKRMGIPLVNTHYQHSKPDEPGVYSDPAAMGQLAADHLIDRGFRRVVIMIDDRHRHSNEIVRAFQKRVEEEGVSDYTFVKMAEETYEQASYWINIEKLMSKNLDTFVPPVGVFVETAPHARLLVQMGLARGFHVPHDLAVLCHHNHKAVVEVSPQISSIEMNHEVIGYKSAEMLDQLMQGAEIKKPLVVVSPVGIIGRESTDFFAVQDPVVSEALQFISSRLTQKLRIDDIAYALAVSSTQLKQRFTASLGRSVGEEIRRLRLEVAKRKLADPGQLIADVAKASGFTNADILNQVFRRELGMTPSHYREKIHGEKFNH